MRKNHIGSLLIVNSIVLLLFLALVATLDRSVTVMKENETVSNRTCLIIDPGHGGVDGGTTSVSGILESNINLEISLKLRDLCHLLGIKTLMIRESDQSVYTQGQTIAAKKVSDLKNRVKTINMQQKPILVSIHQNYFMDSKYSGAQVFYAKTQGSEVFAKTMQQELVKNLNEGSNRKTKKADGIYLMQHIECPGILIECGFLSNPEEDANLRDGSYQKKLCCVIASVCSNYINGLHTA